jgi:hypothetical protein
MGEVLEPSYPFQMTEMDICGPLPVTPYKNRYLLIFLDHLTHYAEAVRIKQATPKKVPERTPPT